ncbi:MAG: type II secretion system F family protein [Chloroherpetonaceae bacterium]|nr:type II secretion system F family protein [Chthonomonadaceae bacterium]MDW8208926.1 type II secretion system F family protein [Chloroherpetonaceae bacterium]
MPEFTYEALDRSGKTTTGTITARDSADAAARVRAMGVFPTYVGTGKPPKNGASVLPATRAIAQNGRKAGNGASTLLSGLLGTAKAGAEQKPASGGKKVTRLHILLFTREMADLLDAGLPMDRAFSVLIDQTDSEALRAMLATMQADIRAGQPLSEALAKFPREFPPLYSNMVRAGEVSGQLPAVMTRLADFMEKEQVRRSQIMAALTYPMVLISVAILAVTFLLTFVIPKLSGIFQDMGDALPLPTVLLLNLSGGIARYWWAILLAIVGAVYGFRAWVSTSFGRKTFDAFRLSAPLLGKLTRKIVAARLVRTLGTLIGGGVPILEAMDIAASAAGNVVATEAVLAARGGVRQGETLHEAMERSDVFLPVVKHMTAVGEETGRLPNMLIRTADTLDFEVDNTMRRLTSLVEPLVVLLMGGFVGFVVLSILLPIFQANTLVK